MRGNKWFKNTFLKWIVCFDEEYFKIVLDPTYKLAKLQNDILTFQRKSLRTWSLTQSLPLHFPYSKASNLRIFHTPHFLHSALHIFCTPHFQNSPFSTLDIFYTPYLPHSSFLHSALHLYRQVSVSFVGRRALCEHQVSNGSLIGMFSLFILSPFTRILELGAK